MITTTASEEQSPEFYVFPTDRGYAARLSRKDYEALTGKGGLSGSRLSALRAAAQILGELSVTEPRSFVELVGRAEGVEKGSPTMTHRRAMAALELAGLICRRGGGTATRYLVP